MNQTERDRIYGKYEADAITAARRLWGVYGAVLSKCGIELNDLTQHAELVLLELIPKLELSNPALPNFIYKSVEGRLRDKFIRGELQRFSNQISIESMGNLAETTPKPEKLPDQNLLLYVDGLDLAFCELVLQGHKPHEARQMIGWNMAEYRAAKQRIADKMGVDNGPG